MDNAKKDFDEFLAAIQPGLKDFAAGLAEAEKAVNSFAQEAAKMLAPVFASSDLTQIVGKLDEIRVAVENLDSPGQTFLVGAGSGLAANMAFRLFAGAGAGAVATGTGAAATGTAIGAGLAVAAPIIITAGLVTLMGAAAVHDVKNQDGKPGAGLAWHERKFLREGGGRPSGPNYIAPDGLPKEPSLGLPDNADVIFDPATNSYRDITEGLNTLRLLPAQMLQWVNELMAENIAEQYSRRAYVRPPHPVRRDPSATPDAVPQPSLSTSEAPSTLRNMMAGLATFRDEVKAQFPTELFAAVAAHFVNPVYRIPAAALSPSAAFAAPNVDNSAEVHINGDIIINSQATDAAGIARDIERRVADEFNKLNFHLIGIGNTGIRY